MSHGILPSHGNNKQLNPNIMKKRPHIMHLLKLYLNKKCINLETIIFCYVGSFRSLSVGSSSLENNLTYMQILPNVAIGSHFRSMFIATPQIYFDVRAVMMCKTVTDNLQCLFEGKVKNI